MSTANSFDGTAIGWAEVGEGEPVVLVHGITESSVAWDPVRDRLADTHRVITLDLRGHGRSEPAERYDLEALAFDVGAVVEAAGVERPHLVGHSLGGAVVSALGAAAPCRSVVNVDQPLRFGALKDGLNTIRDPLEDPATFPTVISEFFETMRGPLDDTEWGRVTAQRRADQSVVLGIWELIFESSADELDAVVAEALGGYAGVPYLSLFGEDPGDDYAEWLTALVPGATVELWPDHGHYPHLVDPDRFVTRLRTFWR